MGTRYDHGGGAVETTLSGSITAGDTAATVDDATGWPSGGGNGDFWVAIGVIDPTSRQFTSNVEKVLVGSRTGTTLSSITRGQDGTSATAHSAGETVRHIHSAAEVHQASEHAGDTSRDDHTQYHTAARHAAVSHTQAMMGADSVGAAQIIAGAVGSDELASAAVVAGKIAVGGVSAADQFAAGVVDSAAIATDAVGTAEIATGAVGTDELAAAAVTSAKVADDVVPTIHTWNRQQTDTTLAVPNTGVYTQLATVAVTTTKPCIAFIQGRASLRSEVSVTGNFDWRARVQVDNTDHPTDAALGLDDGWIDADGTVPGNDACALATFWPLPAAGTYTFDFDMLVSSGSSGDVRIGARAVKVICLEV